MCLKDDILNNINSTSDYSQKLNIMERYCKDRETFYSKKWIDKLQQGRKSLYIWGAGEFGQQLYETFLVKTEIVVQAFCDNDSNKWGTKLCLNTPCISPADLLERYQKAPCHIVIASNYYAQEILAQCIHLGISQDDISISSQFHRSWFVNYCCAVKDGFLDQYISGINWLLHRVEDEHSKEVCIQLAYRRLIDYRLNIPKDETEHFIPELPIRKNEIFVDAGAFTGDTLQAFVKMMAHHLSAENTIQYHALECSPKNYFKLTETCKKLENIFIKLYNSALWDEDTTLCFHENGESSVVSENGNINVHAHKLDSLLWDTPVSWIKMDVEGAEIKALHGCEQLIRKNKPRLSICVYHNPLDLIEIPQYIHSLNPNYKMLLRHHSAYDHETVLYAY